MPVWGAAQSDAEKIAVAASGTAQTTYGNAFADPAAEAAAPSEKDDSFGFGDIVDMINPLQHIPLVNLAYRHVTGDEIKPVAKVIGGTVFSGPVGAASALVDLGLKEGTGKDMTDHVFGGIDKATGSAEAPPQSAQAFTPVEAVSTDTLPGTTIALANLSATGSLTPVGFKSYTFND
jgi:hypothetical protein